MQDINEQFFTLPKAAAFRAAYLREFPGRTFGTNLRIGFDRREQCWEVTGHRFN